MPKPLEILNATIHNEDKDKRLLEFDGNIKGKPAKILFDTGATHNFISESYCAKHDIKYDSATSVEIQLATVGTKTVTKNKATVDIGFDKHKDQVTCYVINIGTADIIIGMEWFRERKPTIDWTPPYKISFAEEDSASEIDDGDEPLLSCLQVKRAFRKPENRMFLAVVRTFEPEGQKVKKVYLKVKGNVQKLLKRYRHIFRETLPENLPPKRYIDHKIELVDGAKPPSRPPYRLSNKELQEMREQLDALLQRQHIRPSKSPYGAPVLFVYKPGKKPRMCMDYRALNKLTIKNNYPLPRIDDLFDRLQGVKFFTKIDFTSGYHQIRISEEDVPKTAFRTRYGHFEFLVLPFGLCNAPATFQNLMHDIFWEHLDKFIIIYLDDIIIYSKTEEEHLEHLQIVFNLIEKNELYVHPDKCEFMVDTVEFLGHIVSTTGIAMDPKKIQAIVDWPTLQNRQDVMSFLGLANYYRKYIQGFSQIAAPISNLLKKKAPFVWGNEEQTAFDTLKRVITEGPILRLPDPDLSFVVTTDASDKAVGAVLTQRSQDTNFDHPVAFHSRKMKPSEMNYAPWAKELLAIVDALKVWRQYLDGQRFTIVTDHQALVHFNTQPKMSRHQARWLELMQEFDYDLIYKPGTTNRVADPLSRRPDMLNTVSIANVSDTEKDKYQAGYVEDSYLKDLYQYLTKQADIEVSGKTIEVPKELHPKVKHYQLRDGLLYFSVHGLNFARLVVPEVQSLRNEILHDNHDVPLAGHQGYDRTYELIQRDYYWLNMAKDIREYVLTCDLCQRNKGSNHKSYGLLKPLPIPDRNWEQISIDFIVSLPMTTDGYDAIMVCVDRLSKMAHFIATHTTDDAEAVSKLYMAHVFRLHGLPKVIVSDRDPKFTGHFWKCLQALLGTKLGLSTAYHPQTDGQTERVNRTLEQMLRAYVNYRQDNWKELLPMVEFAYNNSMQISTKRTPFEVNYGFHPTKPGPKLLTHCPTANDVKTTIDNTLKEVQDHIAAAQISQAKNANKDRMVPPFKLGDEVLVSADHLHGDWDKQRPSRKMRNKKLGPFEIIRVVSDAAYELQLPPNIHAHPVINASDLEKYRENPEKYDTREFSRPEPEIVQDQVEYEVEYIADERIHNNRQEYLVKWKGYPECESTWEKEKDLGNAKEAIKIYNAGQK